MAQICPNSIVDIGHEQSITDEIECADTENYIVESAHRSQAA